MPFGLINSPNIFQRGVNQVFYDFLNFCVVIYLDNTLVFSCTKEDHVHDLNAVFKRL